MPRDHEKIERFRRYAEACARMAQEEHSLEQRTLLNEMARQWVELAEQAAVA